MEFSPNEKLIQVIQANFKKWFYSYNYCKKKKKKNNVKIVSISR